MAGVACCNCACICTNDTCMQPLLRQTHVSRGKGRCVRDAGLVGSQACGSIVIFVTPKTATSVPMECDCCCSGTASQFQTGDNTPSSPVAWQKPCSSCPGPAQLIARHGIKYANFLCKGPEKSKKDCCCSCKCPCDAHPLLPAWDTQPSPGPCCGKQASPVAKAIAFVTQAWSEVKHADPSSFSLRPKQPRACRWSVTAAAAAQQANSKPAITHRPALWRGRSLAPVAQVQHS